MSFKWPALLLLLVSTSSHAYEFPLEIFEYVNDVKVVAFINKDDIDDSMSWNPFEEPPKLTIANVVDIIKKHITTNQELAGAELTEIELRQIPHHEKHWHYMVKLKTVEDNKRKYHYILILMNGKVIPAIREPESFK